MKALLNSLFDPWVNPAVNPSAHPQGPMLGATVLVVGGGAGADLAHWRALQPQRLVVCEPQPALADELQRKLRADAGETLVRGAVAPAEGPLTLQLLNNPRESGVQPPTGLLAHQPRLQVQATLAVPAQTLWQTAEALQLSADAPHLLVLDAPGQASAILQPSLAALQRFEWLVLRTGTEALYAGDAPCTELLAMLQAAAYDLVADEPQTLPPHRELLLRRNPQRLQTLQTEAALAQAREALQQQQADIAELAAVNAGLEATLAEWVMTIERLEARNQTQAQHLAECQSEVAELTQAQHAEQEQARRQQAQWAIERLSMLEAEAARKAESEKVAGEHLAAVIAARQAQAAAEDLAAQRQTQLATLAQELAALSHAHDEQARLAGEQAAQIATLQEAKAAAEQSAAQRQEQIDAMAHELAELAKARDQASQYQAEVAALTQSLQAHQDAAQLQQDQWAAERLGHLESVAARIAEADKAAVEHSAQVHAMTQELAELAKARDEQVQLAGDRAEQIEAITRAAADHKTKSDGFSLARLAAERAAADSQLQLEALARANADFFQLRKQLCALTPSHSVGTKEISHVVVEILDFTNLVSQLTPHKNSYSVYERPPLFHITNGDGNEFLSDEDAHPIASDRPEEQPYKKPISIVNSTPRTKILYGAYGTGNIGDDLTLLAAIRLHKEATPSVAVIPILYSKTGILKLPDGFILRDDFIRQPQKYINGETSLHFAGGGQFWSDVHCEEMWCYAQAQKSSGGSVHIERLGAQGAELNISAVVKLFNVADEISVRDERSRSIISMLGIYSNVKVEKDYVTTLKNPLRSGLKKDGLPVIAINHSNISFESDSHRRNKLINIYIDLARKFKGRLRFVYFPHVRHFSVLTQNDIIIGEMFWCLSRGEIAPLPLSNSQSELTETIGSFAAVIGYRYHLLVLASLLEIPAFLLGEINDSKYVAFAREHGIPYTSFDEPQESINQMLSHFIEASIA